MRHFFNICAAVLCLFLGFAIPIFADDLQFENQLVERIDITIMNQTADTACDTNAILARMKTQEGSPFYQNTFDSDLKTLAQDFDRIDPYLKCVDGKVYIILKVWPKPTVRTITWGGNCKIDTARLQKELGITPCSVFDRRAFNVAFNKVKMYYVKEGFFEAQLCYDVVLDPTCNEVDIQINVDEGRSGRIKKICLVNFDSCEEEQILEKMVTKEYSIFTSWMTEEGTFHDEAMQQDEFMILTLLQNEGYADAKVDIEISEAPQCDRIIITITAYKGERYTCGNLTFKGNTLFCDEDIQDLFTICEGSNYSPEDIRETIDNITRLYGRYGYIDAFVDYEPKLSACDPYVYDIDFTIHEGEQFRVGLIRVFGNCSTQTSVILHEVLLVPGELFNIEKLRKTEEKLTNIGFFKTVNVYAVNADQGCSLGGNYRDVHIEIEETSTGRFGAFAGFSTVESIFGGLNITENNFNYQGLDKIFSHGLCALRGGGEYAYVTATIGTKSRNYVLSWSKPWFLDTPWIVGFDIERSSTRYISRDYEFESSSFRLHGVRQINAFVRFAAHYRIKNTHTNITERHPSHQLIEEVNASGLISAIGASLIYDSTNRPINPTDGFNSRLQGEFVGVGGRHTYLNFAYLNGYFWQFKELDPKGVWIFRLDLRFIQPLLSTEPNHVPLDERFYLGGDETVRGFRPYKPGPKFEDSKDPRGGISLQYVSLEYNRPIFKKLEGFVFLDMGQLSLKRWHFGRLNVSTGFGIKVSLFQGMPPLVLGWGIPLNAKHRSDVKQFFLSLGGHF